MAFIGAMLGTLVGVLPGLGPTSTIAMLMPLTAVLSPSSAIIMMAGIFYGAQYGGSTTSILVNIPGEVSSVPTLLDGYPLAKQGKAGPALGIAAIVQGRQWASASGPASWRARYTSPRLVTMRVFRSTSPNAQLEGKPATPMVWMSRPSGL